MHDLSLLKLVSAYLRACPDWIDSQDVQSLQKDAGVSAPYAFALLMASVCGLDVTENPQHRRLFESGFLPMVRQLSPNEYLSNPYVQLLRFPEAAQGRFRFSHIACQPYEAFVCGDLFCGKGGLLLPQIGFFEEPFSYPALLEGDELWMSITPNEVETMKEPLSHCRGNAATYGLGMDILR